MILVSFRGLLPDALTIVGANTFFVAHLSLIVAGLHRFTKRSFRPLMESLLTLVPAVLFIYFSRMRPDVNARIVIVSVMLAVLYARIGIYGVVELGRYFGSRNWLLIVTCLATSVWFAGRTVLTLMTEGRIIDFMSAGTLHGLSVLSYSVASILIMTDLFILNSQQIENELRIDKQIDRMKAITRKLAGITRYETKQYNNGKIFDIARGGGPPF